MESYRIDFLGVYTVFCFKGQARGKAISRSLHGNFNQVPNKRKIVRGNMLYNFKENPFNFNTHKILIFYYLSKNITRG